MTDSGTNNPGDPIKRNVSAGDMACLAARDMVHRSIDAEASADEMHNLDAHLERCDLCNRYVIEITAVMSRVAGLERTMAATETGEAALQAATGGAQSGASRGERVFFPTWANAAFQ